jgi:hypothetical protein
MEVVATDLAGRRLASREFEGGCTAARVIANEDASEFLVIAQETNIVYVLNIWDFATVFIGSVSGKVTDIAFCMADAALYFAVESGQIHAAYFARRAPQPTHSVATVLRGFSQSVEMSSINCVPRDQLV